MVNHDPDNSIFDEPHLNNTHFEQDISEHKAIAKLHNEWLLDDKHDAVDHSVWDEPGMSQQLTGPPPKDALRYSKWLTQNLERTTWLTRFWVKLFIILITGPFSVIVVLMTGYGNSSFSNILNAVVFAPVLEEPMKIGLLMWVVERRPYWLKSRLDIAICAFFGGLAFATIENVMYLSQPGVSTGLVEWRLTVCTALHISCSLIASIGLMNIWKESVTNLKRPDMTKGFAFLVVAMIVHGAYNAFATFLAVTNYQF